MAIEFHCPYCTATIRVPDEYAGRKGSCPKCSTKLLVPTIERPSESAPPASGSSGLGDSPSAHADSTRTPPADEVDSSSTTTDRKLPSSSEFVGASDSPTALPLPAELDVAPPGAVPEVVAAPPSALGRSLRKRERRRKSQRIYAVAIPLACFVLFVVVIGFLTVGRPPELNGVLRASAAPLIEIPTGSVPIAELNLSADERSAVADEFSARPEVFTSSRMTCQVSAEQQTLQIHIKLTDENFAWFAVNPTLDLNLQNWIRDNREPLNQLRRSRMTAAGTELCKDKLRKADGTPVVFDAARYRDEFGFAALVQGFGFGVEAIANQQRVFAAHEDRNGILYFALPKDTAEFTLRGRSLSTAQPLFPGEYRVAVDQNPATMLDSAIGESTEEAMDPDSATTDMSDASDPDDSDGDPTDDSMPPDSMSPSMNNQLQ